VELARTYSGEPMRRLLNGVVGRIAADTSRGRMEPLDHQPESVDG
jgi:transcription termination factor NusB